MQLQAYCMDTPPGELGQYTQSVKDQLDAMIANGQSISQCSNYPQAMPRLESTEDISRYFVYHDREGSYGENILPMSTIADIQKNLTLIHGFQGLVDGWAGAKTIGAFATFQYKCLPKWSYTIGKIDDYGKEALEHAASAGMRIARDCHEDAK